MSNSIVKLEQVKICKNSVRYDASKDTMEMLGATQPFCVYVPNELLPQGKLPPQLLEITLDWS